jgi:hypothetical protein
MIRTIAALILITASVKAEKPVGEQLRPDWDSGYYPAVVTSGGRTVDITVHVFGREDVRRAQAFGRRLVAYHDSQSEVERLMQEEAQKRFGDTFFARYFVFEAKMGFSLEVRERQAAIQ